MLLYMAARAQLVEEVIRPALADQACVICDRFLLANLVYQGHAGGLEVDDVRAVGRICTHGIEPDCTIVLDMPVDAARSRLGRDLDRMERQDEAYQQRLREGYLAEARRPNSRIVMVRADQPIEDTARDIRAVIQPLLAR